MALWTNNNATNRDWLRENYLSLPTTKYQYTQGVPEEDYCLVNPVQWTTDYLMNLAGKENQEHQLDLFKDYGTNPPLYPKVHEYFRKSQVPLLAVWGKGDPAFIPPGAEAYKKDLPHAEVHLLDAGHFALETKRWEIARIMIDFLSRNGF
jgi:pimeloyl-ACP methyl ester carboxylesterase